LQNFGVVCGVFFLYFFRYRFGSVFYLVGFLTTFLLFFFCIFIIWLVFFAANGKNNRRSQRCAVAARPLLLLLLGARYKSFQLSLERVTVKTYRPLGAEVSTIFCAYIWIYIFLRCVCVLYLCFFCISSSIIIFSITYKLYIQTLGNWNMQRFQVSSVLILAWIACGM